MQQAMKHDRCSKSFKLRSGDGATATLTAGSSLKLLMT